jgi:hypothetical protein
MKDADNPVHWRGGRQKGSMQRFFQAASVTQAYGSYKLVRGTFLLAVVLP